MDTTNNKRQKSGRWREFPSRHPILFNLALIILTGCAIIWIALIALDIWTDHGHYQSVPSVKGMTYAEAERCLSAQNLTAEITDSVYESSVPPGTVMEQSPRPDTKVKTKRSVYLTISAFTPKMVSLPNLIDSSSRQARSTLEGLGFLYINEVCVASEYKGLVLGVRFNGVPVQPGTRVPVSSTITLEVGQGYDSAQQTDSIDTVEYGVELIEP